MKIALFTPFFFPNLGGTERAIEILAREFVALGQELRIVTSIPAPRDGAPPRGDIPGSVDIIRNASPLDVVRAMRWADVGLINYVTLKLGLPALASGKPCVIAHHNYFAEDRGLSGLPLRLARLFLLRQSTSLACSKALASSLPVPALVVYNGYRDDLWTLPAQGSDRPIDVLFVGRVVPDKGLAVLLSAVALLDQRGLTPKIVLIGPEGDGLKAETMLSDYGVSHLVEYRGPRQSGEVRAAQSMAKIVAIPSRREAFGIVALEAMASGCAIVAANVGGLPEAVGPAGILVPQNDVIAWADGLEHLLRNPDAIARLVEAGAPHLEQFSARRMAEGYLAVLREAASGGTSAGSARRAASAASADDTSSQRVLNMRS